MLEFILIACVKAPTEINLLSIVVKTPKFSRFLHLTLTRS